MEVEYLDSRLKSPQGLKEHRTVQALLQLQVNNSSSTRLKSWKLFSLKRLCLVVSPCEKGGTLCYLAGSRISGTKDKGSWCVQGLGFFSLYSSTVGCRRREGKVEGDCAEVSSSWDVCSSSRRATWHWQIPLEQLSSGGIELSAEGRWPLKGWPQALRQDTGGHVTRFHTQALIGTFKQIPSCNGKWHWSLQWKDFLLQILISVSGTE